MRPESDPIAEDTLGKRLLDVVQLLVAEHQRQVAEEGPVEPGAPTIRQDLVIQPQTNREAA